MKWLHFSDFHIGKDPSVEKEVINSLLDAVEEVTEGDEVDAVFLVGDIAYSGKKEQYQRFSDIFLSPLKKFSAVEKADIYAVPGNHDVDCGAGYPISWESIRPRLQKVFFAEDDFGIEARKERSKVFEEYYNFVKSWGIKCPDPAFCVSRSYDAGDFNIILTNTSFFSDFEEDSSKPITPCPLQSLREIIRKVDKSKPRILLGHHSIETLLLEQQQGFNAFLVENNILYLHGHEHKHKIDPNLDGSVRRIGFGAVYEKSLSADVAEIYRNSFAYCKGGSTFELTGFSWDPSASKWIDATSTQFSLAYPNRVGKSGPLQLRVPGKPQENSQENREVVIDRLIDVPRRSPIPSSIIPLGVLGQKIWNKFVKISGAFSTQSQRKKGSIEPTNSADGRVEFLMEADNRRELLVCIPGLGHSLSYAEIQDLNTRLDTDELESIAVVSFGKISSDARTLYQRIKGKRRLEISTNLDLVGKFEQILSLRQIEMLGSLDASKFKSEILAFEEELYLLLLSDGLGGGSFGVMASDGSLLPSNHRIVLDLREVSPHVAHLRYSGEAISPNFTSGPDIEFDREKYLQECYVECNKIRYAALANIGIRTDDYTLDKVYVSAKASERESGADSRIEELIDDHLAVYPASDSLKLKIRERMISSTSAGGASEASEARSFCQRYGSVLLTGDPGSGKTCFVKNEVLAYCKETSQDDDTQSVSWYSDHVPVLISLSQIVADDDFDEHGILIAASNIMHKKGVLFPPSAMLEYLKAGRLAMFLDGLDEVVSVEKRAQLVQKINDLVVRYLPFGNRFIVTSRPAAVQVVNLLPTMHELSLQGLSRGEIRQLATRILQLGIREGKEGVEVDEMNLRTKDGSIIESLIKDCDNNPGVSRLAQNPLLLTLLVMIYANAGAPSAKRHLIYDEAIKTLAAVRGRTAGHHPVSVQDLKLRLGQVALAVYRKESGFLPTWEEVRQAVQSAMSHQFGTGSSAEDADAFIQRVAESTGLIVISSQAENVQENSLVTFMHHSFLEYFAAIGLSKEFHDIDLNALIREPRWHEVLTLLTGVVGESEDVAPVVKKILESSSEMDAIDGRVLQFAIDCALECDVPSEGALQLISKAVGECISDGPARLDPWVRSEIGQRLGQLWVSCGPGIIEPMLYGLIGSEKEDAVAAAILVVAHVFSAGVTSKRLLDKIESLGEEGSDLIVSAICEALSISAEFRRPKLIEFLEDAIKGSRRAQISAFEAMAKNETFAGQHWAAIINALEGEDRRLSRLASTAAIRAGLNPDSIAENSHRREVVLRAFEKAERSGYGSDDAFPQVSAEVAQKLLDSGLLSEKKLGIRLLPFIDADGEYTRDALIKILNDRDSKDEWVAALRAFRWDLKARIVCRASDIKVFLRLASDGTGDVREAAVGVLGCFPLEASVVRMLLTTNLADKGDREYRTWIHSIARVELNRAEVIDFFERELSKVLREGVKRNKDFSSRLSALLDGAKSFGAHLSSSLSKKIVDVVEDHQCDINLRKKALVAFASITLPSESYVALLVRQLASPKVKFEGALVQIPGLVAANCKQDIDYVIACINALAVMRSAAIVFYEKISARNISKSAEYYVTELRAGIDELERLIFTFNEFLKADAPEGQLFGNPLR